MKINGNLIFKCKESAIELFGKEAFEEILEKIQNNEYKELLSKPILSNEWYDVAIYNELLKAINDCFSHEGLAKIAKRNAEKQLKGVLGIFIKFVNIERVLKESGNKWNKIYSEGDLIVESHEENKTIFKIKNCKFSSENLYATIHYFKYIADAVTKKETTLTAKNITEDETEFTLTS